MLTTLPYSNTIYRCTKPVRAVALVWPPESLTPLTTGRFPSFPLPLSFYLSCSHFSSIRPDKRKLICRFRNHDVFFVTLSLIPTWWISCVGLSPRALRARTPSSTLGLREMASTPWHVCLVRGMEKPPKDTPLCNRTLLCGSNDSYYHYHPLLRALCARITGKKKTYKHSLNSGRQDIGSRKVKVFVWLTRPHVWYTWPPTWILIFNDNVLAWTQKIQVYYKGRVQEVSSPIVPSWLIQLSKIRIPCSCSLNDRPSFPYTSRLSRWIPQLIIVSPRYA